MGTSNTGRTTSELRFVAGCELTAKTAFSGALGTSHRKLEQTLNVSGQSTVTAAGSDDTNTLSTGVRCAPQVAA